MNEKQSVERDFIGIEIDKKYYNIAKARCNGGAKEEPKQDSVAEGQINIYDLIEE